MDGARKELVIVGAGPSGLFAAYELSRFSKVKITLVDGGDRSRKGSGNLPEPEIRCPVNVEGSGGAGVFADKLYFDLAGGWLEESQQLEARVNLSLVSEVYEKFAGFTGWGKGREPEQELGVKGLVFKPYPNLISMSLGQYLRFTRSLLRALRERGVKLIFADRVVSVRRLRDSRFALTLRSGKGLTSDAVLLATGRASATWLGGQVKPLGVSLGHAKPLLGVRIETLTSRVEKLQGLGLDPKIRTADSTTKVHCMCYDGYVISCKCEGMVLVDGTRFSPKTANTSFNILTRIGALGINPRSGKEIVRNMNERTGDQPIVQRMRDFRNGFPSTSKSIRESDVKRTLRNARAGDITQLMPDALRERVIDFIDLLGGFVPGLNEPDNLVYAPVFEWFYPTVKMEKTTWNTKAAGLFVSGDVAGHSQGVVMACASGIRAAFAIDAHLRGLSA